MRLRQPERLSEVRATNYLLLTTYYLRQPERLSEVRATYYLLLTTYYLLLTAAGEVERGEGGALRQQALDLVSSK